MAFFGTVGWPIGSLAGFPEGGDPGAACQVPWAVPGARGGFIQGPSTSHRVLEELLRDLHTLFCGLSSLSLGTEQSHGEGANFSWPLVVVEMQEMMSKVGLMGISRVRCATAGQQMLKVPQEVMEQGQV